MYKWGLIVHCDIIVNRCYTSNSGPTNGFSMFFSIGTLIFSIIYGFFAFNKNSFLNKKTMGLLTKLDMKAVAWAIKKLKTDPSNKLARSFCPLSMQPRRNSAEE